MTRHKKPPLQKSKITSPLVGEVDAKRRVRGAFKPKSPLTLSHKGRGDKAQHGFTLIEVLIALAILSIALTAIIKSTSQNIRDTLYLQDKTIAHWVGSEVIAETRAQLLSLPTQPDTLDRETTMLGESWSWHASLSPTPNPLISKIHVDVYRKLDQVKLATLVSYQYAS